MSESESKKIEGEGKLRLKAPRRIVLRKTVEGGSIKQNFSHGRSKSVVVEVRRKKTFVKARGVNDPGERSAGQPEVVPPGAKSGVEGASPDATGRRQHQHVLNPMTPEEKASFVVEKERLEVERSDREAADRERRILEGKRLEFERLEYERRKQARAQEEMAKLEAMRLSVSTKVVVPVVAPTRPPSEGAAEVSAGLKQPLAERPASQQKLDVPREKVTEVAKAAGVAKVTDVAKVAGVAKVTEKVTEVVVVAGGDPTPVGGVARVVKAPKEKIPDRVEASALVVEEKMGSLAPKGARSGAKKVIPTTPKKLTRAQKEDMARKKTEDLVTKRLTQLEELREQKRVLEERRKLQSEEGQSRKTLKTKVKRKGKKAAPAQVPVVSQGKVAPQRRGKSGRGRGGREEIVVAPLAPMVREVIIPDVITVAELASRMAVKASEVVKMLFNQGMMVTINQVLDQETSVLVVEELGHKAKIVSEEANIEAELAEMEDRDKELAPRPPVVTVMGHVDHGKTSLLDAIRETDVVSKEFGGITQHIGAYQVNLKSGHAITVLDTPGHAAFTAMRARGAKMTDVIVLVVAADDGVMPQTVEAINHAKDAAVPVIVAINKIDKVGANPDRVMQQLSEFGLVSEKWGGETLFVQVSALKGDGIAELEEVILLQAEMMNLRAHIGKRARGTIVEAKLDKGRGSVATCLVQSGVLSVGDIFVVGSEWGKIRGLVNYLGISVEKAYPSTPVEIIGLSGVPDAGDDLITVPDERRAKEIAAFRQRKAREHEHAKTAPAQLEDLFSQIQKGVIDELRVVIKGDVRGSVEAVADALLKIDHHEIRVNVIHTGVGGINESDVMLAAASDALVLAFNVRADAKARDVAKREKIDIRFYTVIYDLVDDITKAMEGRLVPTQKEVFLGQAQVREVFRISKVGNVAGCVVTGGHIQARSRMRLLRDNVVIHDGRVVALKRYKDDVKEVREGTECGISLDKFNDVKVGDILEAFRMEEVRQTITV